METEVAIVSGKTKVTTRNRYSDLGKLTLVKLKNYYASQYTHRKLHPLAIFSSMHVTI